MKCIKCKKPQATNAKQPKKKVKSKKKRRVESVTCERFQSQVFRAICVSFDAQITPDKRKEEKANEEDEKKQKSLLDTK